MVLVFDLWLFVTTLLLLILSARIKQKKSVRNTKRFLLKTRSKAIWNKSGSVLTGYKKTPPPNGFFSWTATKSALWNSKKKSKKPLPTIRPFPPIKFPASHGTMTGFSATGACIPTGCSVFSNRKLSKYPKKTGTLSIFPQRNTAF